MMQRVASLLGLLGLFGYASWADTPNAARDRLLDAADLLASAAQAGDRVNALTAAVRAYEAGLAVTRADIRRLTLKERELAKALAAEDADLSTLLALMQNATEQAEKQSLLHPGSAPDTLRAGTLASAMVPALFERAADLESQLRALEDVQALVVGAKATLEHGLRDVQGARIALADALTQRKELPSRLATNDAAMQALINSADTLTALADSLLSDSDVREPSEQEEWLPPVRGRVLGEYTDGGDRPGWIIATEPRALITSPVSVSVRFSNEFSDFGSVVMLEVDGGKLILLAGLSVRFVEVGQILKAGDPVGFAGSGQMAAQDKLNASEAQSSLNLNETLYIELRQGGTPVDPATFLTLEQEQG